MQQIRNYESLKELLDKPSIINSIFSGLVHSFTRKSPINFSDIKSLDISPELRSDLKTKYNYYLAAFWISRFMEILIFLILAQMGVQYVR
ncbi:hypothetical protein [Methanosalsum natronophilum]|uniref:Uncharacterized protein n=1 Tax=Methanosalsum natronophilum TaxID=768733 RepID=A0A424YYD7_9EURY|nr:hypothetical protein [Methanosalsum natronophilum]MCS3923861.1 hypothetical protein [Methanosalsum natronophilum]RQD85790.1 MAG: hypothetical protein D5R95_04320 [Methanosalsum natronophilum]